MVVMLFDVTVVIVTSVMHYSVISSRLFGSHREVLGDSASCDVTRVVVEV